MVLNTIQNKILTEVSKFLIACYLTLITGVRFFTTRKNRPVKIITGKIITLKYYSTWLGDKYILRQPESVYAVDFS